MSVRQRSYLLHGLLVAASIVIVLAACWIAAGLHMSIRRLFYVTLTASVIVLSAAYIVRVAFPMTSRRGVWLRRVCWGVIFLPLLIYMICCLWDIHIERGYPGNCVEFRVTRHSVEYVKDQSNATMHEVLYHDAPGYTRIHCELTDVYVIAIIVSPWVLIIVFERLNRRYPRWSALPWEEKGPTPGFCEKCGYNLSGNVSGICPECGEPVPEEEAVSR